MVSVVNLKANSIPCYCFFLLNKKVYLKREGGREERKKEGWKGGKEGGREGESPGIVYSPGTNIIVSKIKAALDFK